MATHTFSNLSAGYINRIGLFVALTSEELEAGKADLPRDVVLAIRGEVVYGPLDLIGQGDGVQDEDGDEEADMPGDLTEVQYLIPDMDAMVLNTHFQIMEAHGLTGGSTFPISFSNGTTPATPTVEVVTIQPGDNPAGLNYRPTFWYALFKPTGGFQPVEGGRYLEIAMNPALPYKAIYLPGSELPGVSL